MRESATLLHMSIHTIHLQGVHCRDCMGLHDLRTILHLFREEGTDGLKLAKANTSDDTCSAAWLLCVLHAASAVVHIPANLRIIIIIIYDSFR